MAVSTLELLRTLTAAPGAGGLLHASRAAAALLRPYVDALPVTDALGTVTGIRRCGKPGAPLLLLEAHIDEIGLVVTHVDEGGFLRVANCGGVDVRTLSAAAVEVYITEDEPPLPGIVCSTPPHLSKGEDKLPELADMGIDVGLSAEEAARRVPVGSRVVLRGALAELRGGQVCAKSLDDRAGVAAVLLCLERLREVALGCDVAAVFAAQEELGCRGARTAAFALAPQAAIAVDVSYAVTPDADASKCGRLGGGPMLGVSPTLDAAMTRRLEALAQAAEIPLQHEVMGGDTGTDADVIATAGAGVPTALLSVPLRYMHTPAEVVALVDVEHTAALMAAYAEAFGAGA